MLEVREEEIFRWIVHFAGICKFFVLCAVGKGEGSQNPHLKNAGMQHPAVTLDTAHVLL